MLPTVRHVAGAQAREGRDRVTPEQWIINWLACHGEASVVNAKFHDDAADEFGWKQEEE